MTQEALGHACSASVQDPAPELIQKGHDISAYEIEVRSEIEVQVDLIPKRNLNLGAPYS